MRMHSTMSASSDSSATDVEQGNENHPPQLSALFLIVFDQKVGYTVAWKRCSTDVSLDGAVEFKSLPSGLHAVKSDLVYFVHEGYAGLSAFCNKPASAAERNAHFVAVGILVPLSYGRLGRSWLHAGKLEKLASALADDATATAPLEEFWEEQSKPSASGLSPKILQMKTHSRARALSTITAVIPSEQSLPAYHPALSILQYIDLFGPLVYRLQQAALLRKRILFVGAPPVRATCEFVYDLSVLSSLPSSLSDLLPPGSETLHRLRSLFSLGIHDIPLLEKLRTPSPEDDQSSGIELDSQGPGSHGWVACTTDEIIATKKQLYDIIVEIPPTYDAAPQKRRWPTIRNSDGTLIRASQRDVWRYKLLHHELWKYRRDSPSNANGDASTNDNINQDEDERAALLRHSESPDEDDSLSETYDDKVAEPMTWSQLAYSGFMWWASAGEKDAYMIEERDRDREVLGDLSDFQTGLHTAVIAYFHRLTCSLVRRLAALIEAMDDEDGGADGEQEVLVVTRDDLSRVGLDSWSEGDKAFVEDFLWLYFGRRAEVQGANLECCGMQVC
ncbi:uncharacterized protein BDR25DRAFT_288099 [Lindgomyces ingoldianus]|uniref:Uncharacterized protein n=1 Tax=Lindgomyces ingoldianus TaxID=673940 RepID=A0ACB6QRT2_9PLEO|nr:uncharacterized protein BDR25DRAFT_288099 [Lindgomyces ingoldianus]KAF2469729.1 hypothetical protein BDR25DRAFT_288099 [Lindgomyces ingoldianus]